MTSHNAPSRTNSAGKTFLSLTRILIASYFLANATGLVFDPSSRTFFDGLLPADQAALATTIYLFGTAFLIMVGYAVRFAALLLAVFVFWSGYVQFETAVSASALTDFWRDMAMLGMLLMIAVVQPGGSRAFDLWPDAIKPKRIGAKSAHVTKRPAPGANVLTTQVILTEAAILTQGLSHADHHDAEIENIFSPTWGADAKATT